MGKWLIACIRFYQRNLSPLKGGPTCRFVPTCSAYAVEAIQRHGALCGGALTHNGIKVKGFAGSKDFAVDGYDPVPEENPFTKPFRKEGK